MYIDRRLSHPQSNHPSPQWAYTSVSPTPLPSMHPLNHSRENHLPLHPHLPRPPAVRPPMVPPHARYARTYTRHIARAIALYMYAPYNNPTEPAPQKPTQHRPHTHTNHHIQTKQRPPRSSTGAAPWGVGIWPRRRWCIWRGRRCTISRSRCWTGVRDLVDWIVCTLCVYKHWECGPRIPQNRPT